MLVSSSDLSIFNLYIVGVLIFLIIVFVIIIKDIIQILSINLGFYKRNSIFNLSMLNDLEIVSFINFSIKKNIGYHLFLF